MNSLKLILRNLRYFAPVWVFASLNILTGTWVLYIPYIKNKFALNDGQVGLALFCLAIGFLISMPFIPYFNQKTGVGRSTQIGVIILAIAFVFPLSAPSYLLLCAALLFVGFFSGFTDVSMNALIVEIEKREGIQIMSAAHGFFSLGGVIGAGIGTLFMTTFPSPATYMIIMASVIIGTNFLLSKQYRTIDGKTEEDKKKAMSFNKLYPLFGLALISFVIMFNEGAVDHWSNLLLLENVMVAERFAGFGFIAFSLCMTLGRFLGDSISEKIGSAKIIQYGIALSVMAYLLILTLNFYGTIIGFGILGLGLSVIIPELFRIVGQMKGVSASVGISFVSGVGFVGFLVGPVLLGLISNYSSLVYSYVFLLFSILVALGFSWYNIQQKPR